MPDLKCYLYSKPFGADRYEKATLVDTKTVPEWVRIKTLNSDETVYGPLWLLWEQLIPWLMEGDRLYTHRYMMAAQRAGEPPVEIFSTGEYTPAPPTKAEQPTLFEVETPQVRHKEIRGRKKK
jgi:hypothetical protein